MHVTIGGVDYTEISALTFAPETDVTGSTAPINELVVDIRTDDAIEVGSSVALYDDLDQLWCKYWVTDPVRLDEYTVRVRGQSALMLLDRKLLAPVMYSDASATTVLDALLAPVGDYSVDASFAGATLTGYCPEQTARERLQWVVLVIGGYLKNYGDGYLRVLPVDDEDEATIPPEHTYWKPEVTYRDHVTGIRAKYYSYVQREPQQKEEWVEAGGVTYVQTATTFELSNSSAPALAPENWVSIEDVTLLTEDNVDDVLTALGRFYFSRTEVNLDCVNDFQWWPGQKVQAYAEPESVFSGYINSAVFTFGVRAKSSLRVTAAESMSGAQLTIRYLWESKQMGVRTYWLPVGYPYSVDNEYVQVPFAGHLYVFRPHNARAEGVVAEGGTVDDQPVSVALDLHQRVLGVVSVDELTVETSSGTQIGVIA